MPWPLPTFCLVPLVVLVPVVSHIPLPHRPLHVSHRFNINFLYICYCTLLSSYPNFKKPSNKHVPLSFCSLDLIF